MSLFNTRDKTAAADSTDDGAEALSTLELDDVMTKNARNKERMAKERANANKSVLRSYRIKH